ncbi:hypothetical protein [Lactobacillus intestinalis]|uniref:hypothetical protein n=1 Tax=Lactobacillus intestinalis TaxID=151781 RepID=UPI00266F5FD0|nr:hypothetical protein [Lactobacillus intestinalis]
MLVTIITISWWILVLSTAGGFVASDIECRDNLPEKIFSIITTFSLAVLIGAIIQLFFSGIHR